MLELNLFPIWTICCYVFFVLFYFLGLICPDHFHQCLLIVFTIYCCLCFSSLLLCFVCFLMFCPESLFFFIYNFGTLFVKSVLVCISDIFYLFFYGIKVLVGYSCLSFWSSPLYIWSGTVEQLFTLPI